MGELIAGAKSNQLSLAVFRPSRILDFSWEEETRDWDPRKLHEMRQQFNQLDMFADNAWRHTFEVIPKLPYSFSYKFQDEEGRTSELQVLDWEAGQLYWNCLRSSQNEQEALNKVKQKYLDAFRTKDLHFFLGTTQQFHFIAPNPWVIIGVFAIPHEIQFELF